MADRVDQNKNLTVKGGPDVAVKKVDQVVLSYPQFDVNADNRTMEAKSATKSGSVDAVGDVARKTLDDLANLPQPRKQMTGQRNSKHYDENGKAFKTFPGNLTDSDQGN
jgi:hypothetical protein